MIARFSVLSVSSASTMHDSGDDGAGSHFTAPYFPRISSVSLCLCGEHCLSKWGLSYPA